MPCKPLPIRQKSDIPNREGFRLTVKTIDGDLVDTVVIKLRNGIHCLQNVAIDDVDGWMPR